jgi:hypothetical protein
VQVQQQRVLAAAQRKNTTRYNKQKQAFIQALGRQHVSRHSITGSSPASCCTAHARYLQESGLMRAAMQEQQTQHRTISLPRAAPVMVEAVPDGCGVGDHHSELGHDAVPGQARC